MSRNFDSPIHMMEVLGGSFVQALAECYLRADASNQERLLKAFPEYFGRYEKLFAEHQADKEQV